LVSCPLKEEQGGKKGPILRVGKKKNGTATLVVVKKGAYPVKEGWKKLTRERGKSPHGGHGKGESLIFSRKRKEAQEFSKDSKKPLLKNTFRSKKEDVAVNPPSQKNSKKRKRGKKRP